MQSRMAVTLELTIDISFNNSSIQVIHCQPTISKIEMRSTQPESMIHKINYSEVTYGILTLGKNAVTESLSIGDEIFIQIGEDSEPRKVKTHKTSRGRIDGLTRLFKEHSVKEADQFEIFYLREQKLLILTPIQTR